MRAYSSTRRSFTPREATAEDLMLACRMTDGISADLLARATLVYSDDGAARVHVEQRCRLGSRAMGRATRSGPPTSGGSRATSCSASSGISPTSLRSASAKRAARCA
ncbi:MAG: hypothetical protein ACLTSX_14300 [Collinsella sp.]